MLRAPNHWGCRIVLTMSQVLSSIQYIYSKKILGSNMWAPYLSLSPAAIYPRYAPVCHCSILSGLSRNCSLLAIAYFGRKCLPLPCSKIEEMRTLNRKKRPATMLDKICKSFYKNISPKMTNESS